LQTEAKYHQRDPALITASLGQLKVLYLARKENKLVFHKLTQNKLDVAPMKWLIKVPMKTSTQNSQQTLSSQQTLTINFQNIQKQR